MRGSLMVSEKLVSSNFWEKRKLEWEVSYKAV